MTKRDEGAHRSRTLSGALGIGAGNVVALVGGGGKTSLLFALAAELVGKYRTLVTTTTRMFVPSRSDYPVGLVRSGAGGAPATRLLLADTEHKVLDVVGVSGPTMSEVTVIGSGIEGGGTATSRRKLIGVAPGWVDSILKRYPDLLIPVEADGAAQKPLKAPASHEPVIPRSATVVLAVAGLDAVGLPIDEDHVHRPEDLIRLAGTVGGPGAPGPATTGQANSASPRVTPGLVARILLHPEGGAKNVPPGARLVPVINKVDISADLDLARDIGARLLAAGAPLVLLTSTRGWPVVVEVLRR